MKLIGIDLGGRTTNKTAVSLLDTDLRNVKVFTTENVAAVTDTNDTNFDRFINNLAQDIIGIDAPLSLPDFTKEDYLYRDVDRIAGALSPMTIGEITARAIYLSNHFTSELFEVFPRSVLKLHGLPTRS